MFSRALSPEWLICDWGITIIDHAEMKKNYGKNSYAGAMN